MGVRDKEGDRRNVSTGAERQPEWKINILRFNGEVTELSHSRSGLSQVLLENRFHSYNHGIKSASHSFERHKCLLTFQNAPRPKSQILHLKPKAHISTDNHAKCVKPVRMPLFNLNRKDDVGITPLWMTVSVQCTGQCWGCWCGNLCPCVRLVWSSVTDM